MSDQAFSEYTQARNLQLTKNDALRIRTKVKEARDNLSQAGRRWPFELLQNAHDPGPRTGHSWVNANYLWDDTSVTFSHDGTPFSVQELAALLSGGSSKDFESEETTGRFGTGFLVTHVLGTSVSVSGLLSASYGLEQFTLTLERDGDEDLICTNIDRCNQAIRQATQVTGLRGDSATFTYHFPDQQALSLGVGVLTGALPYLFATCEHLHQVRIGPREGRQDIWLLESREKFEFADCLGVQSRIVQHRQAEQIEEYLCLRVTDTSGHSALLVVLQVNDGRLSVCCPPDDFPRVFYRFPIRPSPLSTSFVVDAPFDVNQERNRVPLTAKNKELFTAAFEMMPALCAYGTHQDWLGAHWLSRLGPVQASDGIEKEEADWFSQLLARTAKDLARLPLVWTEFGRLPADSTQRPHAVSVLPRYSASSAAEDVEFETLFALTEETTRFHPPLAVLAKDWQVIFSGWGELRVRLETITLESLARSIEGSLLGDLPVKGNGLRWIARFVDAVARSWQTRRGVDKSILRDLLPDQEGRLTSPDQLWRDTGIAEPLKDISESIGLQTRSRLLDLSLVREALALKLAHFTSALDAALQGSLTEEQLVQECVSHLQNKYPDSEEVEADAIGGIVGSIRLLDYLYNREPRAPASLAQQLPILTADGRIVRWSKARPLMAPVCTWHTAAQPFCIVYPANRILAPIYSGDPAQEIPNVVPALVAWEVAVADPLATEAPKDLKDKRLAALAEPGQDTEGVAVSGETFSQIAFLHLDLLNRCQEDRVLARALLGLVLCYIVQRDASWREVRTVAGKRSGSPVTLRLRRALWLGDLKRCAWVPIPTDDGRTEKHLANHSSLRGLLDDPSWLTSNEPGIALLTDFFGFDALDVRLLGLDPAVASHLRQQLSQLMQTLGTRPADYESLIMELQVKEERRKKVESCRKFGLAVQAAVEQCLRSLKGKGVADVKVVDKGYDYAVYLESGDLSYVAAHFEVGPYYVEVKATTDGVVRLTSTQAEVASANREQFVLCVVDLRGVTPDRLAEEWTAEHVMPIAYFVSDIGAKVASTTGFVESAKLTDIPIRNESALRYAVSPEIWETDGVLIEEWLRSALRP